MLKGYVLGVVSVVVVLPILGLAVLGAFALGHDPNKEALDHCSLELFKAQTALRHATENEWVDVPDGFVPDKPAHRDPGSHSNH